MINNLYIDLNAVLRFSSYLSSFYSVADQPDDNNNTNQTNKPTIPTSDE